jgi:hypothetical protein
LHALKKRQLPILIGLWLALYRGANTVSTDRVQLEGERKYSMPEKVFVNEELGIIEVESYGLVRNDDLLSSLAQIKALAKETGISKVLVCTPKTERLPSFLELDDFGAAIPPHLKVAVVVAVGQPTEHKAIFVVNVAKLKGARVEGFVSRKHALAWLNQ